MSGKLYIWKGAMGTGKTRGVLIDVNSRSGLDFSAQQVGMIVKFVHGAQRERGWIHDRAGHARKGFFVDSASELSELISATGERIDFLALDEVQFFGPDIVGVIARLLDRGVDVLAAGFDYWFDGREDETVNALAKMADTVYYCSARCEICNKARTKYSLRIGGSGEMVDTGAEYKAVCGHCFLASTKGVDNA